MDSNGLGIVCRLAEGTDDVQQLARMRQLYEEEAFPSLYPKPSLDEVSQKISRSISTRSLYALLAEDINGSPEILAMCGVVAQAEGIDQIGGIYVKSEARGQRLSNVLLAHVLMELKRDCHTWKILLFPDNLAAKKVYKALGIVPISELSFAYPV